jgi:hypothetical protein
MQQRGNVQLVFLVSSSSVIQVKQTICCWKAGAITWCGQVFIMYHAASSIRFFVLGSKNGDAVRQIMQLSKERCGSYYKSSCANNDKLLS